MEEDQPETINIFVSEEVTVRGVVPHEEAREATEKKRSREGWIKNTGRRIKEIFSQLFEILQLRARPGNASSTCSKFLKPFR